MTPDQLAKLRAVAEAATPGEWRHGSVEKYHVFVESKDAASLGAERVLLRMNTHFPHEVDAAHIAAWSPSTAIAVLDELHELQTGASSLESAVHRSRCDLLDCQTKLDTANKRIAELEAALGEACDIAASGAMEERCAHPSKFQKYAPGSLCNNPMPCPNPDHTTPGAGSRGRIDALRVIAQGGGK